MILQVKVKAGSRFERIEKDSSGNWTIRTKAPPAGGKANDEVIRLLSDKLQVAKASIKILSGHSSRFKRINIEGIEIIEGERKLSAK